MPAARFVSYIRVSTERQGRSGLGLEAQRKAVADHVAASGGELVAEFLEVESGKRSDRPELQAALRRAKVTGSTLIIAKLDRLARNVHFISGLLQSGVDFVAVDAPFANKLTIHILAAMAEHEREQISARTKAALAAAKARGVKLGNPNREAPIFAALRPGEKVNRAAVEAIKANAHRRTAEVGEIVQAIMAEGVTAPAAIASELNARGIRTPRNKAWHRVTVGRLLERLKAA